MNVLLPLTVTDAMLTSSTVAEPAAGETAWVSAGSYSVDDLRVRSTTHRVYKCVAAHTGRTALPEADANFWLDFAPSNRWAMFDQFTSTATKSGGAQTVVLRPGFFNSLWAYVPLGAEITLSVKDGVGGPEVFAKTLSLLEDPLDWYDWAFGQLKAKTKVLFSDIVPYPDAEATVTVTGLSGTSIGMLLFGDLRDLTGESTFGGTLAGASAEPITYSYIKTDDYGNTTIKRRGSATDLRAKVVMAKVDADAALASVQSVLDVPCAWVATKATGYEGLSVFGLGSGSLSYDGPTLAVFSINVKGMI